MTRILGLALVALVAACGGGGNGEADSGGDAPYCAAVDAGLGTDWVVTCPSGTAEVCGDSRWECDPVDDGWVLTGTSPTCNLRGELSCADGEPGCAPLPDC